MKKLADVKKIATRQSYGESLRDLAEEYPNLVVLDADLSNATKTGTFKKAYPDRFINCGIAESNMMSIAAGLSTTGLIPFASTFAMFAAGRAYEQVRNSIGTSMSRSVPPTPASPSVRTALPTSALRTLPSCA